MAAAGKKFRTKNISQRVQKIVISPIKEMSILADELVEQTGANIISFGQGIPYFDTYPHIKEAIKKSIDEPDTSKYTLEPGITELRELIAKYLEKEKGAQNVQAKKQIMVSAGCQEAAACAIAAIVDPGDEALLLSPAFTSHIEQIIQWGGQPVFVPLDEKNNWRFDINECEKRITPKTKIIVFSNPSNPTGKVLNQEEMKAIADLAIKHDLVIISDETYDFLTYDGVRHISFASMPEVRDRTIICASFSKKYALTGYRVGYATADEGIIDHMLKVHDALTICAPAISQKAAIAALRGPDEPVDEAIKKFEKNRELMCAELDKLSDIFEYQKPQGAYYILVKVHPVRNSPPQGPSGAQSAGEISNGVNSFELALKILNKARVIVIPGAAFGPEGEGHIRFSFAGEPENIKKGFERLRKGLISGFDLEKNLG